MTGYGGYFLQGMASGIQSGFEMGWKKKQKKELEAAQKKVIEEGAILNKTATQMMEDKVITDDEMVKWNALIFASGKEVKEMAKGWSDAIRKMNADACEQYKQKFEMLGENIGSFDMGDFESSYQEATKLFPSQSIYFDAAYNIIKRKSEAAPNQTEDVWGQAGKLPSKYRPGYLQSKGVDIPQPIEASDYISAVNYLSKFKNAKPETFNTIKAGYQKQFPSVDLSNITQESLVQTLPPQIAPQTEQNIEPTPIAPSTETPKPNLLQKGVGWLKGLAGGNKGVSQEQLEAESKATGYDEKAEEEITIKKIQKFSETELYNELKQLEEAGLINEGYYKLLYEEAKRRGLIK